MGRGKLYVCMLALCVCRTLCSRLKDASKYMELEQHLQFLIFVFVLFSLPYV